jgi:hypothetical protein
MVHLSGDFITQAWRVFREFPESMQRLYSLNILSIFTLKSSPLRFRKVGYKEKIPAFVNEKPIFIS